MKPSGARLRKASAFFSFAAICGIAGASSPALAELKTYHVYGPDVVLGEFESTSKTKPTTQNVNVTANTKVLLDYWVVYDTETCHTVAEGTWTVTGKPKKGSFSSGLYKAKPACGPKDWTYNALYYTWKAKKGTKDTGAANWSASYDGENYYEGYKFIIHLIK
jgi:hypothetical protein